MYTVRQWFLFIKVKKMFNLLNINIDGMWMRMYNKKKRARRDNMVSYKPLWITLLQRDITKTELRTKVGFSTATLARMSKNEYVALECIDRICQTLGCGIADVIEILPDTEVTPK